MKKYLRLSCTVCKRQIDKLVDTTHVVPDKCTITFKCEGRLFPIEYRSNASIIAPPVTGLVDWRPRGTVINTTQATTQVFVDTSCGSTKQIVIAAQLSSDPGPGATLAVNFQQQTDTPSSFLQYVYRFTTAFTSVSGVEAGLAKKTLRYGLTDDVQVYLNGVLLAEGTGPNDYERYDGTPTSSVPPNTINFNSQISLAGITQVDVIVSPVSSVTQTPLTFTRNQQNEARLNTGSWENVSAVNQYNGPNLYLFTLDLSTVTTLALNTILIPIGTGLLNGSQSIALSSLQFLLARQPYSTLDRYTDITIKLSSMNFDTNYLKYFVVNGVTVMYVTEDSIGAVFPILQVQKFTYEDTIKTALAGVTNQIVVPDTVIVGPSA